MGGITMEIMRKALEARRADSRSSPGEGARGTSPDISTFAPRIITIAFRQKRSRRHRLGGKMIRSIIEKTGVKIDVEDDGRVNVSRRRTNRPPRWRST